MRKLAKLLLLGILIGMFAFPVEIKAADGNTVVYITDYGKKYHADGCHYLSKSKHACLLKDVVNSHAPCSDCFAPRLTTVPSGELTPEKAVQLAYQYYISGGVTSDSAVSRIQQQMALVVACKSEAEVKSLVQADLLKMTKMLSTGAGVPASAFGVSTEFTPEMAVQSAYKQYMKSGLTSDTAFMRTKQNTAFIVKCKSEAEVSQYVKTDLAKAVPAAATSGGKVTGSGVTAEQIVQQAFNDLVAKGLSPEEAFKQVQENLPRLLQSVGK